jgi:TPR repeat protein
MNSHNFGGGGHYAGPGSDELMLMKSSELNMLNEDFDEPHFYPATTAAQNLDFAANFALSHDTSANNRSTHAAFLEEHGLVHSGKKTPTKSNRAIDFGSGSHGTSQSRTQASSAVVIKSRLQNLHKGPSQANSALASATGFKIPLDKRNRTQPSAKFLQTLEENSEMQYQLGLEYLRGVQVPQNPRLAAHYLRHAAARSHARAEYVMGILARVWGGRPKDPKLQLGTKWHSLLASATVKKCCHDTELCHKLV